MTPNLLNKIVAAIDSNDMVKANWLANGLSEQEYEEDIDRIALELAFTSPDGTVRES